MKGLKSMISFTAKVTKKRIAAAILCAAAIICIASASVFASGSAPQTDGSTAALREQFLRSFGYECDFSSETEKRTAIPPEFDEVYRKYNELQKSQGYDLSAFSGQTATLWSVPVTNYGEDNVFASILTIGGRIIGGDIHSTQLDGFMHGFKKAG